MSKMQKQINIDNILESSYKNSTSPVVGYLEGINIPKSADKIIEPICQNCKHWQNAPFGNGQNGYCNLSRQRGSMMSSGCGLKTHKTFGCNQFEGKEFKTLIC